MKLTKYEHACFTVEKDNHHVIVDPGGFSGDFIAPEHVVAVVVTHQHGDHFDSDILASIHAKNPDAILLADQAVIDMTPEFRSRAIRAGQKESVAGFELAFFGGEHAQIHHSIPSIPNFGVLINDLLYYPGDSFALPDVPVDTLAIPAAAPWLKIGEAMDFLLAIEPRFAFPTHDAILSEIGKELSDAMLGQTAKSAGIEYRRLESAIDI
jgi:L-ascorbate metabolism protein UlaG (beta-lactamase superfamily)